MHIYIATPHTEHFFMFPVRYLVPSFLTRAVLCEEKEAWKRRPFLLSSQICSNYRITSICGSLAAFWLPPPTLSSPVFSLFPLSLLLFAFSPIPPTPPHPHPPRFLIFFGLPSCTLSVFFVKTTAQKKLRIIGTSWHFWQGSGLFGDSIRPRLPKN